VSNVLKKCGVPVSHEWIYQYIHDNKRNKGILYRHLRQGRKRYRKGKQTKAEVVKNAVSIDDRSEIVDTKKRFGDWEIDTVLGKLGTGSIVTLLERKARFISYKEVRLKISQRCDPNCDRTICAV
jgi:IS30 family transposase